MSASLSCECGAPLECDQGQSVGARACPTCGRRPTTPPDHKRRRTWLWLGLGSVVATGLTAALLTAVDHVREAAAFSH